LRTLALSSLNAVVDFARHEWLDLIPERLLDDQPWLLVAKGRALQQRTEYAAAAALYDRAARLLSAANDKEGLLPVLLSSAYCLFSLGRWEESLAVLTRCRSFAGSAAEKTEVLVAQGSVLASLCRWDEAVENYEKALLLAPASMRPDLAPRVHMLRARLFYALGHYRVGKQWVYRSLAVCSERSAPAGAQAHNGAALLEYVTGDYTSAQQHVDKCLHLAGARGYSFIEASALLTRAGIAFASGDYRGGLSDARAAQRMAEKAGDAEELFWVEDMLGDFCRRQRGAKKALEHHRRAFAIAGESHLSLFERVRASAAIAIDQVALGKESDARASLEEVVAESRRWGLDSSLVPALFYLGWVYARSGREHEAARSLTETFRVAAEHEQLHFLLQEARIAVPILALADRFDAGRVFIREQVVPRLSSRLQAYFRVLTEGETYPTDVSLGPPQPAGVATSVLPLAQNEHMSPEEVRGVESLTEREREVLKLIALGMSNKVIAGKMFITEKTVKTHANHVFRKLGVSSRVQAMLVFQSYQRARRRRPARRP
jgi:ATP/maltotriose-dependent transcriptional regulator MalT